MLANNDAAVVVVADITDIVPPHIPKPTSTSSKLLYLEGIRGVAALSVAIFHFIRDIAPEVIYSSELWWKYTPLALFWAGEVSVGIFFVLSGRVLALSYYKTAKIDNLISACLRRPIRLGIPLWFANLVVGILVRMKALDNYPKLLKLMGNPAPRPVSDSFMKSMSDFIARCVETLTEFYVLRGSHSNYYPTGLLYCDLSLSGYFKKLRHANKYLVTSLKVSLFAVFYLSQFPTIQPKLKRLFIPYLFAGYSIGYSNNELPWYAARIEVILPAAAFILLAEISPIIQRIFSSRCIVWLGKVSFGLYLMHGVVLHAIMPSILIPIIEVYKWQKVPTIVFGFAIYLSLSLTFGAAFYRIADLPSVKISRWIEGCLFNEKARGYRLEFQLLKDGYKKFTSKITVFDDIAVRFWVAVGSVKRKFRRSYESESPLMSDRN
ncbi:hypothetical protein BKA69DRAFT_1129683 [Paraphysoderma sedebokerense]|nr:hypothetical protein BKA69DRAFT_1129683 [Paraphysoderma sedebokerense]